MEDKWYELINRIERILIRSVLLVLLVVGLLKILGTEIHDVYIKLVGVGESHASVQQKSSP